MEEWMHSVNIKVKVVAAQKLISQILRLLKKKFPQHTGIGYNIPKFQGSAKILDYIRLFGSAINYFGGPGESHQKCFVKAPGDNTQCRVSEFAKQIANCIYESMIFEIAKEALPRELDVYAMVGNDATSDDEEEEPNFELIGKYELIVAKVNEGCQSGKCELKWTEEQRQTKKRQVCTSS